MKAIAAALLAAILGLVLAKQGKDVGILLLLAVCCMILILSVTYIQPVLGMLDKLLQLGKLDGGLLAILIKVLGVGMVGEIAALVCVDAGNTALGKTVQFLTTAVILWLAVPVIDELLNLLQRVIGEA